jgi:hypothetical protein
MPHFPRTRAAASYCSGTHFSIPAAIPCSDRGIEFGGRTWTSLRCPACQDQRRRARRKAVAADRSAPARAKQTCEPAASAPGKPIRSPLLLRPGARKPVEGVGEPLSGQQTRRGDRQLDGTNEKSPASSALSFTCARTS